MNNPIRSLPPGVDAIDEDVIFGTMWIKAGTLKLIRTSNAQYNLVCQFWGQPSPAILATRSDTPNNQQLRSQKYSIKCPITFFAEYLQQMKNNLRLEVEGVGKVNFDITKFIKKNINIDSKQAFQHFKGFFEVTGKGNRKAGSVQIQMGCQFYPQVAAKQLGQSAIQKIRQSQVMNCPAQKLQVKSCCGHCVCVCPKPPPKNKINNQKQYKEDDPRIAHSLDTKAREERQFDALKYQAKESQIPTNDKQKIQIKGKQNVQDPIKESIDRQKQFPQVPKILTYSNLMLNYDDPELQNQLNRQQDEVRKLQIQKKSSDRSQNNYKQIIKPTYNIGQSVQTPIYEIKTKPQICKQDLMKEFYGSQNSPFKSNVKNMNIIEKQKSEMGESQRDKMSRVINLDKELQRQSRLVMQPPPALMYQTGGNKNAYSSDSNFKKNATYTQGPNGKTKKSDLMLSLFIQIDKNTMKLPNKQEYVIAYRPYGQKERLTLGPNFGKIIDILSLVGENEVRKMGKTPFIIQFWGAVSNKFIGLIRLDLSKIKNGFLLQDRLNEIAIKTNILPTTIQRGEVKIIDLMDTQVGLCNLYAGIGTSNQLNLYLNQKQDKLIPVNKQQVKKTVVQDPQKQAINIKKQVQNSIDGKNILNNFDIFLENLYKNNNLIIEKLNKLMNQKWLNRQQINELGNMIGLGSLNNIFDLLLLISNNKDTIDFYHIAESFDDFIQVVQKIKNDLSISSKTLRNLYSNNDTIIKQIKQHTPMKVISKNKLAQILSKYSKTEYIIKNYLNKYSQYINLQQIQAALMNKSLIMPQIFAQLNKNYVNKQISYRIIQDFIKNRISLDWLKQQFQNNQNINVVQFFKWAKSKNSNVSLWSLMHWFEMVNSQNGIVDCENVNKLQFISNYLVLSEQVSNSDKKQQQQSYQNNIMQPNINNPKAQQIKPVIEQVKPTVTPIDISNQHIQQQNNQQKHQKQPQNTPNVKQQIINNKNEQSQIVEKDEKLFKHLFSIEPKQLSLDSPVKGNCEVVYSFPFDEEQVKSKKFMLTVDKHKYPLKMYGTHGFTIHESTDTYLGDNPVKFYVKVDNRIQYEGALPSDELLIKPNSDEDKIIPLFSDRSQGIAGKIKLNINYQMAEATENMLGKETTYQLYLPKTGYINYSISCQLQPSKIRSQLNIKQQFYMALVFDVFYSNANLKQTFTPTSSKLYSDSTDVAELSGSLKISLSPVILEHFKTNSGRLSLNIIYYSKESGNFERKQVPYAIIQLPLMNIIKAQGIKGDYAFKNKLGMYVTLAHCQVKYQKDSVVKAASKQDQDKYSVSYWLILNFLEFINFQVSKYNWIKMQFVLKGRKYSTQKQQLQQFSINQLSNANILVKFSEEDFADTKVIPVTITTNLSQKLAIDINLKSIMRDTINKKYSINNQYYIVVNQQSKATKMRLALKTYCFKGGPLLSNFVNALHQHLDMQIFQQMDMPQQIQNYGEMLNIFKNKLKLTTKGVQQAMSQLHTNKNNQKLNFEFFTNRTYYKLDFTPILAQTQDDIDFICEDLPTELTKDEILTYFNNNKIQLQNFRPQFLDRFYFKQLNKIKADKNVQFLGVDQQIDLISFVRKIKLLSQKQFEESYMKSQMNTEDRQIQISILEGSNFNQLYNGIKPNAIIRIPQLGMQTQISHRNTNPYFNEQFEAILDKQNLSVIRNLKLEVYHCSADDEDAENILIGEGYAKINANQLVGSDKIIKVIINSAMSNKAKASLNLKIGIKQAKRWHNKDMSQNNTQQIQQSRQASRLGQILHDIKQQMKYKNKLFQSSDEELQI